MHQKLLFQNEIKQFFITNSKYFIFIYIATAYLEYIYRLKCSKFLRNSKIAANKHRSVAYCQTLKLVCLRYRISSKKKNIKVLFFSLSHKLHFVNKNIIFCRKLELNKIHRILSKS